MFFILYSGNCHGVTNDWKKEDCEKHFRHSFTNQEERWWGIGPGNGFGNEKNMMKSTEFAASTKFREWWSIRLYSDTEYIKTL